MSSIAEALKRAQQDRERLRSPGKGMAEEAGQTDGEATLASVVLTSGTQEKAIREADEERRRAEGRDGGLAEAMNLGGGQRQRDVVAAPMATTPQNGTTLSAALRQAMPSVAPAVRLEQQRAETIVEDYTSKRRLNLPAAMVVYHDRAGAVAEQYRKMRDNLMAACVNGGGRRETQVLVLTSSLPGEGKTVTALNLGLSLVEMRANRVLLIDGCLQSRRGRAGLTDLWRLGAEKGLAELLAAAGDMAAVEGYLKATPWHNLFVLPAGARTSAAAAAALLQSQNLRGLLRKVRANFDWILIDAPAAGELPDAGLLGACSDGMLLTVAMHHTPHETVQTVLRRLRSMNLPVKSCIVTRA